MVVTAVFMGTEVLRLDVRMNSDNLSAMGIGESPLPSLLHAPTQHYGVIAELLVTTANDQPRDYYATVWDEEANGVDSSYFVILLSANGQCYHHH